MTALLATAEGDAGRHQAEPAHGKSRTSFRVMMVVFVIAVAARCPGLTRPLLGSFATKNAAYAMIARNAVRGKAPLWRPSVDVLIDGRRGAHLLEMPLAAYAAGGCWKMFGGSLDVWGRGQAVMFGALTAVMLLALGNRWFGSPAGIAAGMAYAFSPVAIIYGQSFMLESSVTFFSVAAMLALDKWRERGGWLLATVAVLCLAALWLSKIYMLVILLPIGWMLIGGQRRILAALILGISVVPAIAWLGYVYMQSDPESATGVYYSLRASASAHAWPPPVLKSPEFYGRLLDDVAGVVLTPVGSVLALFGFSQRGWLRLGPWLAASGVLIVALPLKFHEMNYYFVPILPPLCLLIGLGWQAIAGHDRFRSRGFVAFLLFVSLAFSARHAVKPAFVTPTEDAAVIPAAEAARELSQPGDAIVTLHGTTIDLLYYCDRRGWAFSVNSPALLEEISRAADNGAVLLVIADVPRVDTAILNQLRARYPVLQDGKEYCVYDLRTNAQ